MTHIDNALPVYRASCADCGQPAPHCFYSDAVDPRYNVMTRTVRRYCSGCCPCPACVARRKAEVRV